MDTLTIAGRQFQSRLFVGTGKYRSFPEMARCHEASGAEVITVAVRRVNLTDRSKESLLDHIDRSKFFLLPNTAACYNADEAIRTARLGREVGLSNWVKLEVIGDQRTLFPDNQELLEATRVLVKEGFVVLPYTNDDLVKETGIDSSDSWIRERTGIARRRIAAPSEATSDMAAAASKKAPATRGPAARKAAPAAAPAKAPAFCCPTWLSN